MEWAGIGGKSWQYDRDVMGQSLLRTFLNSKIMLWFFLLEEHTGGGWRRREAPRILYNNPGALRLWCCAGLHQKVPKLTLIYLSLPSSKSCEEVRIGSMIIFHLSKPRRAKFFILCGVIFMVVLQRRNLKFLGSERVSKPPPPPPPASANFYASNHVRNAPQAWPNAERPKVRRNDACA